MTYQEQLITWLNNAYSMEKALIPVLQNHANDARDFPEIHERTLQHIEESKRHAELVKECIEHLGGRVSPVKAVMGDVTGVINSVATEPFRDELVKNFLTDYAAEQFEIASYKALLAAAGEYGEPRIVSALEEILREDEAMAHWLDEHLPVIVRAHIRQEVMIPAA